MLNTGRMEWKEIPKCEGELKNHLHELNAHNLENISAILNDYLIYVSKTGESFLDWKPIKRLIKLKIYEQM